MKLLNTTIPDPTTIELEPYPSENLAVDLDKSRRRMLADNLAYDNTL